MSAALSTVRLADSTSRKSGRSNQGGTNGNCVGVAVVSPVIAVRDSKSPGGGALALPPSFLGGLSRGRGQ